MLIIICILTILVAVFIRNWHRSYQELVASGLTDRETSLKEVNDVELYNYLLEAPQAFVYVGTSENKNCRTFQRELESALKEMSKLDYRYMVYNTNKKEYQFTRICEKTKREARKMLYRLIGVDAYKWRFEIRKVSNEYANKIRKAESLKQRIKSKYRIHFFKSKNLCKIIT